MAVQKILSESEWKGFASKNDIKNAAVPKALAALAKADRQGPEARREAAEAVHDAVTALQRDFKGNKAVLKHLEQMDDAAAEVASEADRDIEAAAKAAADEDEADSPELLGKKMIPLLRELRKGDTVMHALITTAGRNTAVLIMRRSISPARRKMMQEAVDAQGGAKHLPGQVMQVDGAITFVMDAAVAGLAKRVRAALLEQTGLRLKVVVRDTEGVADQDGEDEEDAKAKTPATPEPNTGNAAAALYEQRRATLEPRLLAALKAQHPEATKLRASDGFAQEKARSGDHAAALKALDMVERLLSSAPPPTARPETQDVGSDPAAAFNARLAALLPRVKAAMAEAGAAGNDLKLKASEAGLHARKREFGPAQALLDEVERMLDAAGKTGAPSGLGSSPPGSSEPPASGGAGMAAWQKACSGALGQLKALQTHIGKMQHPRGNAALILLKSIQANLSARPDSAAQVAELRRYLETDDIIREAERPNGFGLTVELRQPLLAALAVLEQEVTA
ncbi:MAG: hypothetical protein ACOVQT_09535 [Rubrivivax sp.]